MYTNRTECIKTWIDDRVKRNEITTCIFRVTVPNIPDDDRDNPVLQKISSMFERNHIDWRFVDSIEGSWNLNRNWMETKPFDCIVEYCGVYPIHWDINDVVELEKMDSKGEIIINVLWKVDDKFIPNH